jgi:membrane protein
VLSSLLALWASSRATRAMIVSCNAFYHEAERRPIWRLLLLSLGLTVSGLVYGAVCVALLVVVPALPRLLRTPAWIDILAGALRWPLLAALMMIWLAAVYTLAPSPRVRGLQWALWGAALASSLWLLVSFLYSTVLTHFARVSATYGALAGTAATMIWLYLSAITILLGAQLNAKIEVHARRA